jgi:hypothetical protein
MKELFTLNSPPVFVEFCADRLKALRENHGIELSLERAANGRLTAGCREKTTVALQQFLGRKSWQPRVRAVCGIGAQGVSLRRITLPAEAKDEFERVLRLQIESEFPLSPDDLTWGWQDISNGAAKRQVLVAAVRKEIVGDYANILSAAGASPEFTVAAFARNSLCASPGEPHTILEIDGHYIEMTSLENGVPISLRILPSGGDVSEAILKNTSAKIIYYSGNLSAQNGLMEKLSTRIDCRQLEVSGGEGFSAATLGLKKTVSENAPLLWLQSKPRPVKTSFSFSQLNFSRAENRRWLIRAAVLLVVLLILPYAEALLLRPLLAKKLASVKTRQKHFESVVNPELSFLQYLKQNQPPYLDTLYIFSKAAPPGLQFSSLSIGQHGDISLRADFQNAQQVMDFRAKLIASGFFSNITVEEQTPVQNQQKVSVRMTAQWLPAGQRAPVSVNLPVVETNKTKMVGKSRPDVSAKTTKP